MRWCVLHYCTFVTCLNKCADDDDDDDDDDNDDDDEHIGYIAYFVQFQLLEQSLMFIVQTMRLQVIIANLMAIN